MNHVVGIDPKQRLIHIQSGAMQSGAKMVLSTHSGMTLPSTSYTECDGTVGGGIASGAAGYLVSRYGRFGDSAKQLEVVLANGDVLQTNRLTKRDVNAKKGLHTFEGEIYRQIDNLITDNKTLIDSLEVTTSGYSGIAKVKKKDGDATLTMERTEDILSYLGAHKKPGQFLCGFSMETEHMLENSRAKLAKKNADMIVANNLKVAGAGFGTDTNVVTLITADDCRELEIMSKADVASAIVSEILKKMC
jgi:hypothetical protein